MRGWACVLCLLTARCGAEIAAIDAGGDAAATPDAADASVPFADAQAPPLAVCPTAAPDVGAPCSTIDGLLCEYGDAPSPSCNLLYECARANPCTQEPTTWQQIGQTKTCPITPWPGCPASFAEASAPDAGACTSSTFCMYQAGVCACAQGGWTCEAAPADCPTERPRLGTPCDVDASPSASCPFDFDQTCAYIGYSCWDGVWMPMINGACSGPPPPC